MRWLPILGILTMLAGLTVFVLGVFLTDRSAGLIVALLGIGIMLAGVALSNSAQRSDLGPAS